MKQILLFISCLLLASVAYAKTYHYEFGTIAEDGGEVDHKFILDPAKTKFAITHAFPGCPCIKATYPRRAINPGQSVAVTVSYDPVGQHTHFTKSVYLYRSDGGRDTLMVTGTVKMTRPLVNTAKFPHDFGLGLSLKGDNVNAGTLKVGRTKVVTFDIYNAYEAGMQLNMTASGRDGRYVTVPVGMKLAPKAEGKFRVVIEVPSDAKPGALDVELHATVNGAEVLDPIPLRGVIVR